MGVFSGEPPKGGCPSGPGAHDAAPGRTLRYEPGVTLRNVIGRVTPDRTPGPGPQRKYAAPHESGPNGGIRCERFAMNQGSLPANPVTTGSCVWLLLVRFT